MRSLTYHKNQLKLVVQFIFEIQGFMSEGVISTPFLESDEGCQQELKTFPPRSFRRRLQKLTETSFIFF